ncbi:hypothetical protein [Tautonia sociabilis]|uniref:Glycosyltransferase RgtA/B/C/D-like domain-containing protein n=1 Tax=Tautonia sociabilis TaxID=2080755 RepID=A0A432MM77_9BACT|nr:hypothetical protein [Tautonia sociabilis]RUL88543.1 hypothetical protein TsocGM_06370 [Tautonia sociabilis]
MRRLIWLAFALTVALAAIRSALFLAHSAIAFVDPLEAFYFEAVFVQYCWRVRVGEPIYLDYRNPPYVVNFFAPLYFLVVGGLGRLADAGPEALARIGRAVSIASDLAAAGVVGVAAGRRYGRGAGLVAGLIGLSSAPLMPFGPMVRPDLMADALGIAGFLAAISPRAARRWLGGALLVLATMTKQTAGIYLVSAVVGLVLGGRPRAGGALAVGAAAAIGAIVGLGWLATGPWFAVSLLANLAEPASPPYWRMVLEGIRDRAPELLIFPALGLVLWAFQRPREPALAALAVLVPAAAVITSRKVGSDLNYFLGARLVAALAAGAVWGWLASGKRQWGERPPVLAVGAAVLVAALLVPGLRDAVRVLSGSVAEARFYASDRGRATLEAHRLLDELASDPNHPILTDCGPILLHMGTNAPLIDPWLFRDLCMRKRIRPFDISAMITQSDFDAIISVGDLLDRDALTHHLLLPPDLILETVETYRPAFAIAPGDERYSLYVYLPRDPTRPAPPQIEAARRLAPETMPTGSGGSPPRSGGPG